MPVQSNNDWDPLEEIIIGTAENCVHPTMNISTHSFIYGGEDYEDIKHFDGQPIEQWIVDEANEDLEGLEKCLQGLGVKTLRPDPIDHNKIYSTPEWTTTGWYTFCPRDLLLPLDNMIIECPSPMRARYFETRAYYKYLYGWMKEGTQWINAPKPILTDDNYQLEDRSEATLVNKEIIFDAFTPGAG